MDDVEELEGTCRCLDYVQQGPAMPVLDEVVQHLPSSNPAQAWPIQNHIPQPSCEKHDVPTLQARIRERSGPSKMQVRAREMLDEGHAPARPLMPEEVCKILKHALVVHGPYIKFKLKIFKTAEVKVS